MFLFDDTEKALNELFEVMSKGIDLLANDSLNADLYYAYEKYVITTVKLVDNAYWKNYTSRFEEKNPFNSYPFTNTLNYSQPQISPSAQPFGSQTFFGCVGYNQQQSLNSFMQSQPSINYKEKLRTLLQKITTILKELTSE